MKVTDLVNLSIPNMVRIISLVLHQILQSMAANVIQMGGCLVAVFQVLNSFVAVIRIFNVLFVTGTKLQNASQSVLGC